MQPADQWSLKEYRPEGTDELWIFRKNLAPALPVADPRYPWVAYVTFSFTPRDASGLPGDGDAGRLAAIEEHEFALLEAGGQALFVGAVLKPGIKDALFYARDAEHFEQQAGALARAHPAFAVGVEVLGDPRWEHYLDFP